MIGVNFPSPRNDTRLERTLPSLYTTSATGALRLGSPWPARLHGVIGAYGVAGPDSGRRRLPFATKPLSTHFSRFQASRMATSVDLANVFQSTAATAAPHSGPGRAAPAAAAAAAAPPPPRLRRHGDGGVTKRHGLGTSTRGTGTGRGKGRGKAQEGGRRALAVGDAGPTTLQSTNTHTSFGLVQFCEALSFLFFFLPCRAYDFYPRTSPDRVTMFGRLPRRMPPSCCASSLGRAARRPAQRALAGQATPGLPQRGLGLCRALPGPRGPCGAEEWSGGAQRRGKRKGASRRRGRGGASRGKSHRARAPRAPPRVRPGVVVVDPPHLSHGHAATSHHAGRHSRPGQLLLSLRTRAAGPRSD